MMTLEEAIAFYEQYGKLSETYKYYSQLTAWLRELQERRKADSCEGCVKEFGKGYLLVCTSCKRNYADLYEPERRADETKRSD